MRHRVDERSAGAVVYHRGENSIEYLLLKYGAGHWDFPKGHIEKNESEIQAVLREVREETGINDLSIIDGFRKVISYMFMKEGRLVRKEVVFYLGEASDKTVTLSPEHLDYVWLNVEKALEKLTFKTAKETLVEADNFLKTRLNVQI
ncbi:MAG: bis(5'-nucleosyl)-tetraphosphatase [Candidatus Caldarchaeum sp.]|nr:bis(5'-nucleosyl)-tetraphosphatase [Candidatus Caldarchaeum sp.]MCX8201290.1 bis(5'-nucleosyl)-tetraphosphatase [Candidatus Caldarchaeum sp.]MDW8062645.1 bis(5'-nucleosyl)-tetraphosphatase [Candidatus Caldarchaeum sp.]